MNTAMMETLTVLKVASQIAPDQPSAGNALEAAQILEAFAKKALLTKALPK